MSHFLVFLSTHVILKNNSLQVYSLYVWISQKKLERATINEPFEVTFAAFYSKTKDLKIEVLLDLGLLLKLSQLPPRDVPRWVK